MNRAQRVSRLLSFKLTSTRSYIRPSRLEAPCLVSATSNSSLQLCQHHQIRSLKKLANEAFGQGKIPPYLQEGDWVCSNCQAHNFASRGVCFDCAAPIEK